MSVEIEIKLPDVDFDDLRLRLKELGASCEGSVFERNIVFDDTERSLKSRGVLLRLRRDGRSLLTVKRPPADGPVHGFKSLEECEVQVSDADVMEAALSALGYVQAFRYEKVRETWRYGGVSVCLDRLPFGDFVELEGEPSALEAVRDDLNLSNKPALADSYHELNRLYRRKNGLPDDENYVFQPSDGN